MSTVLLFTRVNLLPSQRNHNLINTYEDFKGFTSERITSLLEVSGSYAVHLYSLSTVSKQLLESDFFVHLHLSISHGLFCIHLVKPRSTTTQFWLLSSSEWRTFCINLTALFFVFLTNLCFQEVAEVSAASVATYVQDACVALCWLPRKPSLCNHHWMVTSSKIPWDGQAWWFWWNHKAMGTLMLLSYFSVYVLIRGQLSPKCKLEKKR